MEADEAVQNFCDAVKWSVERKTNQTYDVFVAKTYRSQVVSGLNYFIKVDAAGRFHGYVDLGCGIVDDSLPPAEDALVLMVVAIDDSWKIPVAYFLIDGLTGEERSNIIKECLL
ncbi:hypothetical protein NHX12_016280 [Muraenolepis orangiensis]|uniref:Transposable element P transposase-like RNase H domain-containing protein n=1 Tax=Muraenolepis orangiensis TaxID=630683 RepID=A0A9Q0I902_9TELE|nr:hypothetical protein NHX12_006655 [Muraenolepis orangiensis]KAJ3615403.1 hypothetical protein NHX12_016280 [Muraenolepis orangiensis]